MTSYPPARSAEQRKRDVLQRWETDEDAWVSSASSDGTPCLVPLSFIWHGDRLLMATKAANPTARNLKARGDCWVAMGPTRDVVLVHSAVEIIGSSDIPADAGDAFARKLGWDPRGRSAWVFLEFRPHRVLAWREENELAGRELMKEGGWLV